MANRGAPKGNNNPGKNKDWRDAVRKAVKMGGKLDTIAKKVVSMAEDGDMQAIQEIANRLDGKPVQESYS
jgi:ADP-ribosylglycohydrolase